MSRPSKPNGMTVGMTQIDEMTRAYADAMPRELAGVMNLMAHPMAGFAAAGALGLGMASQAVGLWMGAVAGIAEASQKLLVDAEAARPRAVRKPVKLELVRTTPTPEAAAAAARTVTAEAERVTRKAVEAAVDAIEAPVAMRTPAMSAQSPAVDDLKAISGIGPKLEKVLNGLGIFTYEQVAKLTTAEIAKLDEQLGFAGRIERDDWLGQAARLAGK